MIRGWAVARPKPWEVDDELWAVIEPLLPRVERRARHPGRKRHVGLTLLHPFLAGEDAKAA
jgi:transposase